MKTRVRSAEPGEMMGALLRLFRAGSYRGEPFPIPGENQLSMTDSMWGWGNVSGSAADRIRQSSAFVGALSDTTEADPKPGGRHCRLEDAYFGEAAHLCEMAGPAGMLAPEKAMAARRFSLACGRGDPVYLAGRAMLTLILHRQVERFLVLVRGAAEREAVALSLSAYLDQAIRELPRELPCHSTAVTVYANGESDMTGEGRTLGMLQLRRFVCDEGPQILLMNREYCNRPENLLLRPDMLLDGQTPLSMLTPAHPVVVTMSETARDVASLLERSEIFAPLCTLSFTEELDGDGVTVPVYSPGMHQSKPWDMEPEQIML